MDRAGTAEHSYKRLEMAGHIWKYMVRLDMAAIAENGFKWLVRAGMAENG